MHEMTDSLIEAYGLVGTLEIIHTICEEQTARLKNLGNIEESNQWKKAAEIIATAACKTERLTLNYEETK